MQGGRGNGGSFNGFDPFADFGGFGGFGGHQNMLPSLFGGRDPFDDPFFARPFGSSFGNMIENNIFGPTSFPFTSAAPAGPTGFIEHQGPHHNKRRGPVIEELNSDDENANKGTSDSSRKHYKINKEPQVEIPVDEGRNQQVQYRNEFTSRRPPQSQSQCFTFQSSSASYGGTNGAYYTKSMTRREGSDGVKYEEFKEADSTTGQANHRVTRGLYDKGHTLSRKLESDGRVDSVQTLHNLNEDELSGFEQAWEGSAGRHLPGWRQRLEGGNMEPSGSGQMNRGGWALPYTHHVPHPGRNNPHITNENESAAYMQRTGRKASGHGPNGRTRA